jgi:hypothetical protein
VFHRLGVLLDRRLVELFTRLRAAGEPNFGKELEARCLALKN